MTWLRLDDQFHRHRKVAPLSDAAFRLHVTVLLECANQLTDGRIDCALVPLLPRAPTTKASLRKATDELERAGLWHREGDEWVVHDFLDWNPPAADILAKRAAARDRMRDVRKGNAPRTPPNVRVNTPRTEREQPPNIARSSPNPVPVPVPVPVSSSKADGGIPRPSGLSDTPPPSEVRRQPPVSEVRTKVEPPPQVNSPEILDGWRPRNRQEALNAPIADRAKWAMREQWAAAEYSPQDWPEVQQVAQAFHRAYGLAPAKLGRLDSDKLGTLRLVSLLTQYTPEQLVKVCEALPREKVSKDRIAGGERPRLGWLSDEVVRTSYAALPTEREVSPRVKRALANLEAQGFGPMKAAGEQ